MNPLDRYAPEDDYVEEEWDAARDALWVERRDLGWDDDEIAASVDDYLIAEKCDAMRQDRAATWADDERARRKEGM